MMDLQAQAQHQLAQLLGYTKTLDLPPTHLGRFCGDWWATKEQRDAQTELQRQGKLSQNGKTDEQLLVQVVEILRRFPSLAGFQYLNFSQEKIYPVWYLVLFGGSLAMVEEVHHMYPKALQTPLGDDMTFTLLTAACSRDSTVSNEVVLFVARHSPSSFLSTRGSRQLPYISRLFTCGTTELASLDLIQALVPPTEWNLETIAHLVNEGYDATVMAYAVDQLPSTTTNGRLQLGPHWRRDPGCFLDGSMAKVLERLLPKVGTLVCKPPQWSLDGFLHTWHLLSHSTSVHELVLRLDFTSIEDRDDRKISVALEQLFATNTSIEKLHLSIEKPYLEAIARGLSRRKTDNKLHLVLEMIGEPTYITQQITSLFAKGFLQSLYLQGPVSSYMIDIPTICHALLQDTTLQSFELDASLSDSDCDALLDLLQRNATLHQLVAHNSATGMDYTGFTLCPQEISSGGSHWCAEVHSPDRAEQMLYYMRLNRFGRHVVRTETTTRADFVELLNAAHDKLVKTSGSHKEGQRPAELDYFNVVFGLLIESEPRLWNP